MKALKPLYKALYYVCWVLAQLLIRIVYPVRGIGRKNIPKGEGCVLACNHLSAIDPMFVLMARGVRRKGLVMGKEELFGINPVLDFLWNVFGTFAVKRGTGDRSAIDNAVKEVKTGRDLLIFPEGTRSKDGNLGRLKSGAFVVALEAEAKMVPCRIHYAAGGPKPFRRITVAFGEPVTLAQLGLEGGYSASKLRAAKKIFSARLEELAAQYGIQPVPRQLKSKAKAPAQEDTAAE